MVDQSSSRVRAAALRNSALSLARLADAGDLVGREVVEHHDVVGPECRRQELLDVGAKCGAGHRSVEHQPRDDAAPPEPRDQGRGSRP